jgi:hypothetical protein
MKPLDVLLLFPGSLFGESWADGPRVKPELVGMLTYLRRHDLAADVLDLEVELGGNPAAGGQERYLAKAEELLRARPAAVVVFSCWSSLQYSATVAVAECVRRLYPETVIAVSGYHLTARPVDFTYEGSPFNWLLVGDPETALVEIAGAVARGDRDVLGCRALEGMPLELSAETVPDYAAYPYTGGGLLTLPVYLSRGCPYHTAACLLRPGGAGWHAYPPDVALRLLDELAALKPRRVEVLDPAFGFDNAWRMTVLDKLAETYRRLVPVVIAGRPDTLTRQNLDRIYSASLLLRLDVETLSKTLLARLELPDPQRRVEQAMDLMTYANAKGIPTTVRLAFNQPGETRETAAETLAALEQFVAGLPNSSLRLQADSWAFFPSESSEADVEPAARRFGTVIAQPEWWKEPVPSAAAATAVVASRELADLAPGDDSYWRPRFAQVAAALEEKLTAASRHGQRSHESVGSAATDVPHGWWVEGRWH